MSKSLRHSRQFEKLFWWEKWRVLCWWACIRACVFPSTRLYTQPHCRFWPAFADRATFFIGGAFVFSRPYCCLCIRWSVSSIYIQWGQLMSPPTIRIMDENSPQRVPGFSLYRWTSYNRHSSAYIYGWRWSCTIMSIHTKYFQFQFSSGNFLLDNWWSEHCLRGCYSGWLSVRGWAEWFYLTCTELFSLCAYSELFFCVHIYIYRTTYFLCVHILKIFLCVHIL